MITVIAGALMFICIQWSPVASKALHMIWQPAPQEHCKTLGTLSLLSYTHAKNFQLVHFTKDALKNQQASCGFGCVRSAGLWKVGNPNGHLSVV